MNWYCITLKLGKRKIKDRVSTKGCANLNDFKRAIQRTYTPLLDQDDPNQLSLWDSNGILEIDPETPLSSLSPSQAAPILVQIAGSRNPRTEDLEKYRKQLANGAMRAFFSRVTEQLEKEYHLEKSRPDAPLALEDVIRNLDHGLTTPKPPNELPLDQKFSVQEWDFMRQTSSGVHSFWASGAYDPDTIAFLCDQDRFITFN